MTGDRVLRLDGVHNFRDYGGYAVADGGRLRRGLLWRSGQHVEASDADLARIAALDLAMVFDLRSPGERRNHPCRRPEGFAAIVHEAEDTTQRAAEGDRAAPHVSAAVSGQNRPRDAEGTRENMRRSYRGIAFRPPLVAMMRAMFADLATRDGASLVNCMAGKDRTGIAVAMVLTALGTHPDDVLEDYLLTNTAGDPERRIAAGGRAIIHLVGELDDAALRAMMGVEAEYLAIAMTEIAARHGSVDAYLAEVLGADAGLRERLRARLVV